MDWNCNLRPPFVTLPDNNHLSFFYNYNYDPYQEMQTGGQAASMVAPTMMMDHHHHQNKNINYGNNNNINNNHQQQQEKKKQRLTSEQMESLEKSFQEEIKLDPDRKMKLAKELGMEPRQIAVWFQNRRARWRTKELERLYDALKLEYDAVSREKDKLQQEVVALRSVIKEQLGGGRINAVSAGYNNNTEISGGEETVESTSIMQTSTTAITNNNLHHQHMPPGTYIDHYNSTVVLPSSAYWAAGLPTYH